MPLGASRECRVLISLVFVPFVVAAPSVADEGSAHITHRIAEVGSATALSIILVGSRTVSLVGQTYSWAPRLGIHHYHHPSSNLQPETKAHQRRGADSSEGDARVVRSSSSRSRTRLYVSASLAITATAVAKWSKREADRSYERYLTAANRETQKDQFDRAERYDRLSGAAYAAMEAGVVLTAYFVFF